jgi:hypothetical protein
VTANGVALPTCRHVIKAHAEGEVHVCWLLDKHAPPHRYRMFESRPLADGDVLPVTVNQNS